MDTKALKKQMGAAIAMVLVAAIALGSATFAWFVSNNTVKATTANISAQSNAPFLKIAKSGETLTDTSATQTVAQGDLSKLYPSQWANEVTSGTYQFESAYASKAESATMLAGSRFAVGGFDETTKIKNYALKQSFDIGTTDENAGSFKNLKVASIAANTGSDENNTIKDALCVLIKCGDKWAVYKADNNNGAVLTAYADGTTKVTNAAADGILADTIAANSKETVDLYIFYDGSQSGVNTNEIGKLGQAGVTVTFTATPVNTDGGEVNVNNDANASN